MVVVVAGMTVAAVDEAEVRSWWRWVGLGSSQSGTASGYDKIWGRVLPLVPAMTDTGHLTWRQRAVMASVDVPSLTMTTTALAHISALLLPFRDLFVASFSGPGSYSRLIPTLFVLGNPKNVPFAWHVRLAPLIRLERRALPLPLQQTQHKP